MIPCCEYCEWVYDSKTDTWKYVCRDICDWNIC